MKVNTLMYHDLIGPDGSRGGFDGAGAAVYAVTAAEFGRQMDRIDERLGTPPLRAGPGSLDGSGGAWMVTFDDGGASATIAGDELARRGWVGHFFVVTARVGEPGFLGWEEIRELAAQGHVIGSHSHTHPARIAECSPEQLRDEWEASTATLRAELDLPVWTASVPGGYYSDEVGRAAAAAGVTTLFTSEPTRAVGRLDGCALVGRFAVREATPTAAVVAAAAGASRQWLGQRLGWSSRRLAKRLAGRRYEQLRAYLLRRR
jgi:peptidoglycan/xylan/chitin deacetylase (PgdA/CDA1 family)